MRDIRQTFRTFAARACATAALTAALAFALHATAGSALAQEKTAQGQENVLKESGVRRPSMSQKPLEDWARRAKQLFDEKKLDAFTRVDVTATAELNDDGTFKPESVVLKWATSSDGAIASLAQQLFDVMSQSKVFSVLEGAKQVSIRLRLDDTNAFLNVSSALPSAERARQLAEGYSTIVNLTIKMKKGTREGELYECLRFASDEKLFTLTFEMDKERLGYIITEMLAKRDAAAHS